MKVTAFLKYDLYPYYIVLEGELQENFDVKTSCGTYSHTKVLRVKPFSEYDLHSKIHRDIKQQHDRCLRKLKVDLLKQNGIDFINTENF
ncbi:hypothetical protein X824_gp196 [Escherichia phage 4MG]|uniref:Hyphothetical protein n=1 Tax=Escherichia phage 4MG TaxID=1391428 RepID=V5KT09_9CAUD|nr:hypothetical protein X824_gp196 [Escherichia phage 4MG]AGZ17627.1 hyphothetical protein [Escherichia phage 4MG]